MNSLIGSDQNPLRQGFLRAVALARREPDAAVIYAVQDIDRLGRPGDTYRLKAHQGSYFSLTFDHPGTPRVRGVSVRLTKQLAGRGHPPSRVEIVGPELPLIGAATVDAVIHEGWRSEVAWALRCGADPRRAAELSALLAAQVGQPLVAAMRAIAAHALADAGLAWPDNLRWTTLSALLGHAEPELARLPNFAPWWLWGDEERPGAGNIPRGMALPLELSLRGYRLFATRLSYWTRVAELAAAAGVPLTTPRTIRAPLLAAPDPGLLAEGLVFHPGEREAYLADWSAAWTCRPTLIWALLHGVLGETLAATECGD